MNFGSRTAVRDEHRRASDAEAGGVRQTGIDLVV